MSDVFLERTWPTPVSMAELRGLVEAEDGCFGLYRVEWRSSYLSSDARRLICHFHGPDAESVRIALRHAGADLSNLWHGTVHDAPGLGAVELASANVLVMRSFDTPVALEELQDRARRNIGCLEIHRVTYLRTFFSTDKRRMVCLYHAPDAESVRLAQRAAQMPHTEVWAVQRLGRDSL
jgi:hypothetical protein